MYDLEHLTVKDMTECGIALRKLGTGAGSMEGAAQRVVRYLYDELGAGSADTRGTLMVRFYKTHRYAELEPALQTFAAGLLRDVPTAPSMLCLTLLATAGDEASWNDRHHSSGHRAIPLPSAAAVARLPMVARLVSQMGLEVASLLEPDPALILDLQQRTFGVFHVQEALGSPYIPAQQAFVVPHAVRSALGFGGVLPSGDLFSVILFTRVPLSREVADLFAPLALAAKLSLLPFSQGPTFHSHAGAAT